MTAVDITLFVAAIVGALVQSTIGVGFALIMAPLAAILRPDLLPGALILLAMPLNAWVAVRERHALDLVGMKWITAGRVVGGFAGLAMLAVMSARGLNLLIGIATILAVAASLLAPRFTPGRSAFATAGLVTGVTETATGIGGPPLTLVFQHQPPATLRANVAVCFLIGEVLSIGLLVAAGSLGLTQLVAALALVPAVGIGILFSDAARRRVEARALRKLVLLFALLSAAVLILHT